MSSTTERQAGAASKASTVELIKQLSEQSSRRGQGVGGAARGARAGGCPGRVAFLAWRLARR